MAVKYEAILIFLESGRRRPWAALIPALSDPTNVMDQVLYKIKRLDYF